MEHAGCTRATIASLRNTCHAMPCYEAYDDYIRWYLRISHPRIQNPTHARDMPPDEETAPDPIAVSASIAKLFNWS